jgi:hypothetical protein
MYECVYHNLSGKYHWHIGMNSLLNYFYRCGKSSGFNLGNPQGKLFSSPDDGC